MITQYHLECASDYFISLIGSLFFVGTFIGSMFLPRLADIFGRKPVFITGLILHLITVFGVLLGTNKYLLLVFMCLGGLSEVGRYYVAYVYAVEVLPKRLNNIGGMIIFCHMSITKICICCYLMFGS